MLELAKLSQTILIDGLILRTTYARNALGPWLTIFCNQSKGLPFIAIAWGLWDLILLQGDGKFEKHWLYFTGFEIYAEANSGSYILKSEFYFRFLFSMVFFGLAITLKSTMVTLFFSERMVGEFRKFGEFEINSPSNLLIRILPHTTRHIQTPVRTNSKRRYNNIRRSRIVDRVREYCQYDRDRTDRFA